MAEWDKRIFAVNLIVGDLERSKTFYRAVFGLSPLDEWEDGAIFRFGDTFIALRHDASNGVALAKTGVGQFAIEVDDVDAVGADLEARGVTLISAPQIVTTGCARSPSPIRTVTPGARPGLAVGGTTARAAHRRPGRRRRPRRRWGSSASSGRPSWSAPTR